MRRALLLLAFAATSANAGRSPGPLDYSGVSGACLEVFEGELIVAGGQLISINGVPINGIARYDGTTWRSMGEGLSPGAQANDLQAVGSELFASVDPISNVI